MKSGEEFVKCSELSSLGLHMTGARSPDHQGKRLKPEHSDEPTRGLLSVVK